MSEFRACAEAIRHKGFDATANLVDRLAVKKPKLFAAVSIGQTGYGDEVTGISQDAPRVFLTRKSANEEALRLTCVYLRTVAMSELLENMETHRIGLDPDHVSSEMTRILGEPFEFPGPGFEYWNDPRCESPLLAADTDDAKTAEIAKLLKLKFFKTVSVPCDINLSTPPISEHPRGAAGREAKEKSIRRSGGLLSFLRWPRK